MLHIHEINVNSLSVFKTCLIKQSFEHVLKIILVNGVTDSKIKRFLYI